MYLGPSLEHCVGLTWARLCQISIPHLCEALLAVILEVFGVDVDVILVDSVRLGKPRGVLQELVHLHRGSVKSAVLEGAQRHVRGRHTV